VQSIQQECLDHFLVFGQQHFDHLISEYVNYYHTERTHQSLENKPLVGDLPEPEIAKLQDGEMVSRSRLGGWLKSYERRAA
jgi:putative transposase